MVSDIEALRYDEAVSLPKFKASLDRLLDKKAYNFILTVHSISLEDLLGFVERTTSEGNVVLIQKGYNGYMVIVWKD